MGLPRSARRAVLVAVGVPCVVVVTVSGELTSAALLAVGGAGGVVTAVALAARSGAAAPPVGRAGRPWLLWIALVLAWEVTVLALPGVPSLSDLLDPLLAQPLARAAATAGWLAAGGWLLARPSGRDRP